MNEEWLNTSSIYAQSHNRFYVYIIYPVLVFIFLAIIFIFIFSKEVVIKTIGEITTSDASLIQITEDKKIIENNMKENLQVKKGDVLIEFENEELKEQKKILIEQNIQFDNQLHASDILKNSLITEENQFEKEDKYGYINIYKSFIKDKENSKVIMQYIEDGNNEAIELKLSLKGNINYSIEQKKVDIDNYKQLRSSFDSGKEYPLDDEDFQNQFSLYKIQVENSEESKKEEVKKSILLSIDEKIKILESEINSLENELLKYTENTDTRQEILSIDNKIQVSKEQILSETATKKQLIEVEKEKNIVILKEIDQELKKSHIQAQMDGILHLENKYNDFDSIPKGTVVAKIFPNISKKKKLEVVLLVPSAEIYNIDKGMHFRFKVDKKGVEEENLSGEIVNISQSSNPSKSGSYYEVRGILNEGTSKKRLKYGTTGEISIIVGKKTYFNYLKDIIFSK